MLYFDFILTVSLIPLTSGSMFASLRMLFNYLGLLELSNCITASTSKTVTMIKAPVKPKKVKEPKEPKKPSTTKKAAESPTSKPKRKRTDAKKATKETDRKILVAVDL